MTSFYNLLIGIGTMLVGFLAFADQIAKIKLLNFFSFLFFKILIFLAASILIIWGTMQKDNDAEDKSNQEKIEAKQEQHERDSIAEIKRQESNNELTKSFGEAIGKYGYEFDSLKKELKEVRTSAKRPVNIKYGDDPVLAFCWKDGIIIREIKDNSNIRFE